MPSAFSMNCTLGWEASTWLTAPHEMCPWRYLDKVLRGGCVDRGLSHCSSALGALSSLHTQPGERCMQRAVFPDLTLQPWQVYANEVVQWCMNNHQGFPWSRWTILFCPSTVLVCGCCACAGSMWWWHQAAGSSRRNSSSSGPWGVGGRFSPRLGALTQWLCLHHEHPVLLWKDQTNISERPPPAWSWRKDALPPLSLVSCYLS